MLLLKEKKNQQPRRASVATNKTQTLNSLQRKRIIGLSSLPRAPADRFATGAADVDGAAHRFALAGRDRERQERGGDDENRGRCRAGERRLQCLLEERRERREVKGERRELGGEVGGHALEMREVEGRGGSHGWLVEEVEGQRGRVERDVFFSSKRRVEQGETREKKLFSGRRRRRTAPAKAPLARAFLIFISLSPPPLPSPLPPFPSRHPN